MLLAKYLADVIKCNKIIIFLNRFRHTLLQVYVSRL